eukprot:2881543-Prymnesium_polylepis.2
MDSTNAAFVITDGSSIVDAAGEGLLETVGGAVAMMGTAGLMLLTNGSSILRSTCPGCESGAIHVGEAFQANQLIITNRSSIIGSGAQRSGVLGCYGGHVTIAGGCRIEGGYSAKMASTFTISSGAMIVSDSLLSHPADGADLVILRSGSLQLTNVTIEHSNESSQYPSEDDEEFAGAFLSWLHAWQLPVPYSSCST